MEVLVSALKSACTVTDTGSAERWSSRYAGMLVQLLALYFEEDAE